MVPVFRYLFSKSKEGEDAEKLVKIALELVQARKEGGHKVSMMTRFLVNAKINMYSLS